MRLEPCQRFIDKLCCKFKSFQPYKFAYWLIILEKFTSILYEFEICSSYIGFLQRVYQFVPQKVYLFGRLMKVFKLGNNLKMKIFNLLIGRGASLGKMIKKWGRARFCFSCNYSWTVYFLMKLYQLSEKNLYS